MTTIIKKSILSLSITAIMVAGLFMFSPILVDADDKKKQTCPAGNVMTGIDKKGNIICSAVTSSPATYQSTAGGTPTAVSSPGAASATSEAYCDPGDKVISRGALAQASSLNGGTIAAEAFAESPVLGSPQGWEAAWAISLNENTITPNIAIGITALCADTALPAHTP